MVPCVRLCDVCESLPQPMDEYFFSWEHDYGGLIAIDAVHSLPWNSKECFLGQIDDTQSDESEDETETDEVGNDTVHNASEAGPPPPPIQSDVASDDSVRHFAAPTMFGVHKSVPTSWAAIRIVLSKFRGYLWTIRNYRRKYQYPNH